MARTIHTSGLRMRSAFARVQVYSRIVRLLRVALPVLALSVIALLIAWPRIKEVPVPVLEESVPLPEAGQSEVLAPRFEGRDSKGRPFVVTAGRALQSNPGAHRVDLESPQAEAEMEDGSTVQARAESGHYDPAARYLILEGGVTLSHESGHSLSTARVSMDLPARRVRAESAVSGGGPEGTLEAAGLTLTAAPDLLILEGPAKLVLHRAGGLSALALSPEQE